MIFVGLIVVLGLPLFSGVIRYSFGSEGVASTGKTVFDSDALLQIALIEVALGGIILWFVPKYPPKYGAAAVMRITGKMLLVGACSLIIVSLLSPFLPDIKDSTYWWDISIRYLTAIFFIFGGMSLVAALISCVSFIWEL